MDNATGMRFSQRFCGLNSYVHYFQRGNALFLMMRGVCAPSMYC